MERNMKVLIVGGGGREHAIATSVKKSSKVSKIYCAPGNAGIAAIAECAPIGAMEFDKLVAFAKEKEHRAPKTYDVYGTNGKRSRRIPRAHAQRMPRHNDTVDR